MRSFAVVLSTALLVTHTSASPVTTTPLTKLQLTEEYPKGFSATDRARAALFKREAGPTTVPTTNVVYTVYTTTVGIGNPPTYYTLLVDTGSSLTFCGAGTSYVRTSTSIPTGQNVSDTYGSGYFSGLEYLDQATIASNLVITNQSIGDALSSSGFANVDGILGLGPAGLTKGLLSPATDKVVPTVMDNLASQGLIKDKVLSVHFSPALHENDTRGALTFGGIDSNQFEGELTYVPVTETHPSSAFWGFNITSSTYGDNHTVISTSTAGILDTGTTQVLLADDLFESYMAAIPGATWDSGLLEIPSYSSLSLKPLSFVIGDRTLTMDATAQRVPPGESIEWGGEDGKAYGVVSKLGRPSGAGFDFVFGQAFIERFYTVLDADANRIGFAQMKS